MTYKEKIILVNEISWQLDAEIFDDLFKGIIRGVFNDEKYNDLELKQIYFTVYDYRNGWSVV